MNHPLGITEFEHETLAVLQAHSFLLTALARGQLKGMSNEEVDEIIAGLLHSFSALELPDNANRDDEEVMRSIDQRHQRSQEILRQMLEFARPR